MAGESNLTRDLTGVELGPVKDRIRGSIFASACGNSLGGSGIGMTRKDLMASSGFSILRDYLPGLSRSQSPNHTEGAIHSDIYAAMAFAETLIESGGHFNLENIKKHFKVLLEDEEFIATRPGAISLSNIREVIEGGEPLDAELTIIDVAVPFRAFVCGCLPGEPRTQDPLTVAKQSCLPTPTDPRILAAAAVIADSVGFFVRGNRLDTESEVRDYVRRELDLANSIDDRFADAWDGIAPDLDYTKPAQDLPYSVVNVQPDITELVPTAVGIFLVYRHSLEDAVGIAALAGGKTDSVAAIVGALAGAYHGVSAIPERWMDRIAHKKRLESVSLGLEGFWH
jgi:ADP-ribosylglycohydrolase